MLARKALMRANGLMEDVSARQTFTQLRTRYQRVRRDAMETHRLAHFTSFIGECQGNPRALRQRLTPRAVKGCPVTDVNSWRDYFDALYNNEVNPFHRDTADNVLSFINGKSIDALGNWMGPRLGSRPTCCGRGRSGQSFFFG